MTKETWLRLKLLEVTSVMTKLPLNWLSVSPDTVTRSPGVMGSGRAGGRVALDQAQVLSRPVCWTAKRR